MYVSVGTPSFVDVPVMIYLSPSSMNSKPMRSSLESFVVVEVNVFVALPGKIFSLNTTCVATIQDCGGSKIPYFVSIFRVVDGGSEIDSSFGSGFKFCSLAFLH